MGVCGSGWLSRERSVGTSVWLFGGAVAWNCRFGTLSHSLPKLSLRRRAERVVITKQGRPFLGLVLARGVGGMSDERAAAVRRELGLEGVTVRFSPEFDDPAFSRAVLRVAD